MKAAPEQFWAYTADAKENPVTATILICSGGDTPMRDYVRTRQTKMLIAIYQHLRAQHGVSVTHVLRRSGVKDTLGARKHAERILLTLGGRERMKPAADGTRYFLFRSGKTQRKTL